MPGAASTGRVCQDRVVRVVTLGDLLLDVVVRLEAPLEADNDVPGRDLARRRGQAANVAAWAVALGARRPSRVPAAATTPPAHARRGGPRRPGRRARRAAGRGGGRGRRRARRSRRRLARWPPIAASPGLDAGDVDRGWLAGADALHLSGYSLLREPISAAARGAAALPRRYGTRVIGRSLDRAGDRRARAPRDAPRRARRSAPTSCSRRGRGGGARRAARRRLGASSAGRSGCGSSTAASAVVPTAPGRASSTRQVPAMPRRRLPARRRSVRTRALRGQAAAASLRGAMPQGRCRELSAADHRRGRRRARDGNGRRRARDDAGRARVPGGRGREGRGVVGARQCARRAPCPRRSASSTARLVVGLTRRRARHVRPRRSGRPQARARATSPPAACRERSARRPSAARSRSADRSGIRVMATGGLGGVHRGFAASRPTCPPISASSPARRDRRRAPAASRACSTCRRRASCSRRSASRCSATAPTSFRCSTPRAAARPSRRASRTAAEAAAIATAHWDLGAARRRRARRVRPSASLDDVEPLIEEALALAAEARRPRSRRHAVRARPPPRASGGRTLRANRELSSATRRSPARSPSRSPRRASLTRVAVGVAHERVRDAARRVVHEHGDDGAVGREDERGVVLDVGQPAGLVADRERARRPHETGVGARARAATARRAPRAAVMPSRSAGPCPVAASVSETSSVPRSCAVVYLQHGNVGLVDDRRGREGACAAPGPAPCRPRRARAGSRSRCSVAVAPSAFATASTARRRRPRAAAARWPRRLDESSTSERSSDHDGERSGSSSSRANTPSRIASLIVLAAGKRAPAL